jgi:uncharacterized protein
MSETPSKSWNPMRVAAAGVIDPDGSRRPVDHYDAPLFMADSGPVQFHVMIKPGGAACNLACDYCFYLSKATLADGPGCGRMTDDTLELLIRRYIEDVSAGDVVFTWQGGEPTLLGLEFFQRAVALQKKYAQPGRTVQNDLQTNGTLIDEAWCRFLKQEGFLVGLSIDGPRDIHDRFRVTKGGEGTFDKVMATVKRLKEHGIPFNTLTCVHRYNARRPLDVYRFLRREIGSTRIQFTPVVEPRGFETTFVRDPARAPRDGEPQARPGSPDSIVTDWSVDPDDWGYFLSKTFDEWHRRDLGKVLVSHFETLISQHLGRGAQMCVSADLCGKGVAVEHDGSVYACDHFVYPEFRIGNLRDRRLRDTVLSRRQVQFGYAKTERLPTVCRNCPYLMDCQGECPKNRIISTAQGDPGLNYLCRGLKAFYPHALPRVDEIVSGIRKRNAGSAHTNARCLQRAL